MSLCDFINSLSFRYLTEAHTWIARSQIILDALVDQVNQVTVLTDQNRYEQVALKMKQNLVSKYFLTEKLMYTLLSIVFVEKTISNLSSRL